MKRVLRIIIKTVVGVLLFLLLYVGIAFLFSKIEVSGNPDTAGTIAVWTSSNGTHTDIIVPVKTSQMDWRTFVSPIDTRAADSSLQYVSFGWGDKTFFLNTPNWSDLKVSTALNAALGLGEGAMHVTYTNNLEYNPTWKKMMLNEAQYQSLITYIRSGFTRTDMGVVVIPTEARYGNNDAFYASNFTYSLFYTCNTWTHNGLAAADQAHCPWTVLAP
jgi:uncharacterized protein (TIGR02117 family)